MTNVHQGVNENLCEKKIMFVSSAPLTHRTEHLYRAERSGGLI